MRSLIAHAIALFRSKGRLEAFLKAVEASAAVVALRRKEAKEATTAKANALRYLEAARTLHAIAFDGKTTAGPPQVVCERFSAHLLATRAAAAAEARFAAAATVHASLPPIIALARADCRALEALVAEEAAGVVSRALRARSSVRRECRSSRLSADAAPFYAHSVPGADAGLTAAAVERGVAAVVARALTGAWGAANATPPPGPALQAAEVA